MAAFALLRTTGFGAVALIFLFMATGCSENYGRLQRSRDANLIFKNYQVLPDHKYYYTGPEGRPEAIIGIRDAYTLETTQWTRFHASTETLKTQVDSINFYHPVRVGDDPYGSFILGPDGIRLGIWYSIWDWTAIIVREDHLIQVFPPAKKDIFENGEERERMKAR